MVPTLNQILILVLIVVDVKIVIFVVMMVFVAEHIFFIMIVLDKMVKQDEIHVFQMVDATHDIYKEDIHIVLIETQPSRVNQTIRILARAVMI